MSRRARPPGIRRRGLAALLEPRRGRRISPTGGLVIGLALGALGLLLAVLAARSPGHPLLAAADGEAAARDASPQVLGVGLFLALLGAALAAGGLRGHLARRRHLTTLAARPDEPWLADHPWRREGAVDETWRQARKALALGGLVALVGSTLCGAFLATADGALALVPIAVFGVPVLAGLAAMGFGVYLVLRRARHGVAEVTFARFPFFLGQPLEVALRRQPGTPPLPALTARLTCLDERWVESTEHDPDSGGRRRSRSLERFERWSAEARVPSAGGAPYLPIRFDLPPEASGAPPTALSADPPRYWELSVAADLPGIDYGATFLVPVYRPGRYQKGPGAPQPAGL